MAASGDARVRLGLRYDFTWGRLTNDGEAMSTFEQDSTPMPDASTPLEPFVRSLDAMGAWRKSLEQSVHDLKQYLREQSLLDEAAHDQLESLRRRLGGEKLVVAFVAEFSRGKSELINAIFFAESGRRIMPASPGRTTMCPVELGWDAEEESCLSLLPIETRLEGASLAELRDQPRAWVRRPLDVADPEAMALALTAVMETRHVSVDQARALGFWSDDQPADNPPLNDVGEVEIPLWRHAVINAPHPLLKRGLVVLDTPGLNAIGAEPELTVGLLPSAHVVIFVLGADTGVTRSDMEIWRDHLASQSLTRYVVLNKIDAVYDPLSSAEVSEAQIARQCTQVARTLDLPSTRVFPLSARQALAARVEGNAEMLVNSRLLPLEQALAQQLLPQRRSELEQLALESLGTVQQQVQRGLTDLRRQVTEQLLELRGLRGKSSGKVKMLLQRVTAETGEFEQCTSQLQALRAVHSRMLREILDGIAGEALRTQVEGMVRTIRESLLKLGAKRAFLDLFTELRSMLDKAQRGSEDIRDLLAGSFSRLNADFGFSLSPSSSPDLSRFRDDLALIERNYVQYLGLSQALRLAQPQFLDQFRRMLLSRLRVVFESAASEIELWNRTASGQIDAQLRERRKAYKRRVESLERIRSASHELESRVQELEAQESRLARIDARLIELFETSRRLACQAELTVAPVDVPPIDRRREAMTVAPPVVPTLSDAVSVEEGGSVVAAETTSWPSVA